VPRWRGHADTPTSDDEVVAVQREPLATNQAAG